MLFIKCVLYFSSKNISTESQQQQMAAPQQQMQPTQIVQLQKPQKIMENNNYQTTDASQKRRLSRTPENTLPAKNALPLENHTKGSNESHYIKNKALQSPVNKYKVGEWESI